MNRFSALIVSLSILAAGCGDSAPTAPSQGTTTTSTFAVPLSPANEVPAITNADASSGGSVVDRAVKAARSLFSGSKKKR